MNATDSSNYKILYYAGLVIAVLIAILTLVQTMGLSALGFNFGTVGTNWLVLIIGALGIIGKWLPSLSSQPTAARINGEKSIKMAEKVAKKVN